MNSGASYVVSLSRHSSGVYCGLPELVALEGELEAVLGEVLDGRHFVQQLPDSLCLEPLERVDLHLDQVGHVQGLRDSCVGPDGDSLTIARYGRSAPYFFAPWEILHAHRAGAPNLGLGISGQMAVD